MTRTRWQSEEGIVWLEYPPAMIIFKPYHHEFKPFPGLAAGLIPIFPSEVSFNIRYQDNPKQKDYRWQFPICAGYAFTDHKGQGQTLGYIIIDIGTMARFPVVLFAAYVALSRSKGQHTIRLLRDFDEKIFTCHPSEHLRHENDRLDRFDAGYYDEAAVHP
jgi:hypothetical protein